MKMHLKNVIYKTLAMFFNLKFGKVAIFVRRGLTFIGVPRVFNSFFLHAKGSILI